MEQSMKSDCAISEQGYTMKKKYIHTLCSFPVMFLQHSSGYRAYLNRFLFGIESSSLISVYNNRLKQRSCLFFQASHCLFLELSVTHHVNVVHVVSHSPSLTLLFSFIHPFGHVSIVISTVKLCIITCQMAAKNFATDTYEIQRSLFYYSRLYYSY